MRCCIPNWTRRFEAVWRRQLRRRKPERNVDRANEDEPGADFFGEGAPIAHELAPEIWARLIERFGFYAVGTMSEVGRKQGRYWDVGWFEKALAKGGDR